MSALGPDGDSMMAAIASRALERNRDRIARLADLLAHDGDLAQAPREEAVTLAHQVAGSAGTFGYDDASTLARTAMERLTAGAAPSDVRDLVAQVRRALD